jgi:hypothetical protein
MRVKVQNEVLDLVKACHVRINVKFFVTLTNQVGHCKDYEIFFVQCCRQRSIIRNIIGLIIHCGNEKQLLNLGDFLKFHRVIKPVFRSN